MLLKTYLFILVLFSATSSAWAATESMDFFQQMGKMYVVVVVVSVLLIGLAFYLYRLDSRIRDLEKRAGQE